MDIRGIQYNSKEVKADDWFVAIPGQGADGHRYIEEAIQRGAAVVVGEHPLNGLPVPYYRVSNARKALAELAMQYYGYSGERHQIIGITGTNGKTTVAQLLRAVLEEAGIRCSCFGTLAHMVNGREIPSTHTTPDPLFLHQWLSQSRDDVVIMEVSSHGLDQYRVHGIQFDYAVFTNLTHDHVNYHPSMEHYFQTKCRLFDQLKSDGEAWISGSLAKWGEELKQQLRSRNIPVFTFGDREQDDVQIVTSDPSGRSAQSFHLLKEGIPHKITLQLPGKYNTFNAAAAWAVARSMGIRTPVIQTALEQFDGIPGRFECYSHPAGGKVIVDYAHTPDAFERFLETVHGLNPGRMIHIFGFRDGGDDSKRWPMLNRSARWCDQILLTVDNQKEKTAYFRQLEKLIEHTGVASIVEDRTLAIEKAWQSARKDDYILITGRGPEAYSQPFALPCRNDRETVQYLMEKSGSFRSSHE